MSEWTRRAEEDWAGFATLAKGLTFHLPGAPAACNTASPSHHHSQPQTEDCIELEEAPCFQCLARDYMEENKTEKRKLTAARSKFERSVLGEKLRLTHVLLEEDFGWCPAKDSQSESKAQRDLEHLQETRAAQFNARQADSEGKLRRVANPRLGTSICSYGKELQEHHWDRDHDFEACPICQQLLRQAEADLVNKRAHEQVHAQIDELQSGFGRRRKPIAKMKLI